MKKNNLVLIFELNGKKSSSIIVEIKKWQKKAKKKFRFTTIVKTKDILSIGIKPRIPQPPEPPMMPDENLDSIGPNSLIFKNSNTQIVRFS